MRYTYYLLRSHSKKKVRAFRSIGNNFFPTVKTALWRCSTPYPRLTSFDGKGTPFVYLILKNRTPLTYLVKTFASLLTAVKALSLKIAKSQNQNVFSFFFYSHKFHLFALLDLFTSKNDIRLYPSICFN